MEILFWWVFIFLGIRIQVKKYSWSSVQEQQLTPISTVLLSVMSKLTSLDP